MQELLKLWKQSGTSEETDGTASSICVIESCDRTIMDHLKVKWLSFIHIIEVLNGDDQAQLQDGQT